jgi:hypothetical protein
LFSTAFCFRQIRFAFTFEAWLKLKFQTALEVRSSGAPHFVQIVLLPLLELSCVLSIRAEIRSDLFDQLCGFIASALGFASQSTGPVDLRLKGVCDDTSHLMSDFMWFSFTCTLLFLGFSLCIVCVFCFVLYVLPFFVSQTSVHVLKPRKNFYLALSVSVFGCFLFGTDLVVAVTLAFSISIIVVAIFDQTRPNALP